MSATIVPTTEIDAVNLMLLAIGESPVSSLSGDVGDDVVSAKATLTAITRAVCLQGWLFNTEYNFPLTRDIDGYISVPTNALKVNVQKTGVDAVWRGARMYDRTAHSYIFADTLTATMVFGLKFEELPESARNYISYRACRKFQDTSIGSNELHRFNVEDEFRAFVVFSDDQTEDEDLNMLRDTPDFATYRRA